MVGRYRRCGWKTVDETRTGPIEQVCKRRSLYLEWVLTGLDADDDDEGRTGTIANTAGEHCQLFLSPVFGGPISLT